MDVFSMDWTLVDLQYGSPQPILPVLYRGPSAIVLPDSSYALNLACSRLLRQCHLPGRCLLTRSKEVTLPDGLQ